MSSTRLNSTNTAADWADTAERQIVGGKRRSMNRSNIRMPENLCRRLPAARRRQKYEPDLRVSVTTSPGFSISAHTASAPGAFSDVMFSIADFTSLVGPC